MKITKNWIDGRPRHSTAEDGTITIDEPYLVAEVGGDPDTRMARIKADAQIPGIGTPHPSDPGVRCVSVDCEPLDGENEVFLVRAQYATQTLGDEVSEDGGDASGLIQYITGTVTEETIRDVNGNLLKTRYFQQTLGSITLIERQHRVAVERPTLIVVVSRDETGNPRSKIEAYSNKVNKSPFNGFKPKQLLSRISGRQIETNRFAVDYEFVLAKPDWRAEVNTQVDGLIPLDVKPGNGIEYYDVYETAEFSALKVAF